MMATVSTVLGLEDRIEIYGRSLPKSWVNVDWGGPMRSAQFRTPTPKDLHPMETTRQTMRTAMSENIIYIAQLNL